MIFGKALSRFGKSLRRHGPDLGIGFSIAGYFTSSVLTVFATKKAIDKIEEVEKEKGEPLTTGEKVKETWTYYIPAATTAIISTAALITSVVVKDKRFNKKYEALAAAYAMSESTIDILEKKTAEVVGEKKMQEIKDGVAHEQVKATPYDPNNVYFTGTGNTLCYDPLSGRYFRSDANFLGSVKNNLNDVMRANNSVSLNKLYWELNIPSIELGEYLGWNVRDGWLKLDPSSDLTSVGEPVLVMKFDRPPTWDYDNEY